jgi:AraC-like DNA-binding protein
MMPEMDGFEFCKKIKTEFQTSHIPVILLTARVSDESKYEGLETGADDYLTKPFDSKELFIRIKNLLEQRKRLKEKFGKDLNVKPSLIAQSPVDKEFLERAFSIAEKYLDNPDFDAESFAKELFMSLSQLRRKLKAVTGQAPGEFLRTYKLKRAAQMILEKRLSITQISLEIGFNSPSHFTKAFREQINCLPSDFKG